MPTASSLLMFSQAFVDKQPFRNILPSTDQITHGNTSNRNRSLILNSRFRDFYSVHKSEVEGTSLFTGACSVENRHKKSPTDSGKYKYIVYSAWAETWRRIWGGPKNFSRPNFRKNFHFQNKNF